MSDLILKNLSKRFGEKEVLSPFTLEVKDRSFLALLGPSGCGKTTLLRIVAGLERPSGGEIWLGSRMLFGQMPHQASGASSSTTVEVPPEDRGLGMVFQSYAVWPHMTVEENVRYPLDIQASRASKRSIDNSSKKPLTLDQRQEACEKALSLVHLLELKDRYPHQLSGGQQQRVALARGLAVEPPILLLDEPLSNLDAKLRSEMRREIREIHRKLNMTILYVTHDQREAFEMATDVVILNAGAIAQKGTPSEILKAPNPGFVTEFLSES